MRSFMTWGAVYWPWYLITASLAFIIPEGTSVIAGIIAGASGHTDNTLSYYARYELGVSAHMTVHTIAWWASLITWILGAALLTVHIWFDVNIG